MSDDKLLKNMLTDSIWNKAFDKLTRFEPFMKVAERAVVTIAPFVGMHEVDKSWFETMNCAQWKSDDFRRTNLCLVASEMIDTSDKDRGIWIQQLVLATVQTVVPGMLSSMDLPLIALACGAVDNIQDAQNLLFKGAEEARIVSMQKTNDPDVDYFTSLLSAALCYASSNLCHSLDGPQVARACAELVVQGAKALQFFDGEQTQEASQAFLQKGVDAAMTAFIREDKSDLEECGVNFFNPRAVPVHSFDKTLN